MSIKSLFENIANAIKNVYGTTDTLTPAEMPQAITNFNSIFQTKELSSPIGTETTVEGCLSSLSSDLSELSILKMSATPYTAKPNEFDANTFFYTFVLGQNVGLETIYGPLITYAWYDASVVNSVCQVFIGASIHVRRNTSATTWGAWS